MARNQLNTVRIRAAHVYYGVLCICVYNCIGFWVNNLEIGLPGTCTHTYTYVRVGTHAGLLK